MLELMGIVALLVAGAVVFGIVALLFTILKVVFKIALIPVWIALAALKVVLAVVAGVVVLVLVGPVVLAIGIALYFPVSQQRLGGIALSFQTGAVVFWSVLLLTLGVLSSLVAARRVLRIDPIEATTGAAVGRLRSRSRSWSASRDASSPPRSSSR